jgi:hypothetical protein
VGAAGAQLGDRGRRRLGRGLQRRVPLVQPGPDVVSGVGPALPLVAREHGAGRRHAGETGQS